ncbi:MAG: 1-deoxy-D-xylulose-5-phosphate synthase [Methylocystaceae bacterium]
MVWLDTINHPGDIKQVPRDELPVLADEIRHYLVGAVARTGGHLASNLGVVELTLALHYVLDLPQDKIIWDVGHQSYVHKILTGRREQMDTLRQFSGICGFPRPEESDCDAFATGHSSTSVSAALGMAITRDLLGKDYEVVAVIGDGALTGGMAFEAMNHAGHLETNLIVILNDNGMSISRNVGALARHLTRLRTAPGYYKRKRGLEGMLKSIPMVGHSMARAAAKFKDTIKYLLVPGIIFEEMGFTYLGPIDGHNINNLVDVLKEARRSEGPVLLHVHTNKGYGYEPALISPTEFHGIGPFDVETGLTNGQKKTSYTQVFGQKLVELAAEDDRIVAITAAMASGTGLTDFACRFPERFQDVGICEQHAVTLAAGMAASGLKPVVAVYSTFLQRAYDQVLHDVCLQKLPVVLAIDRAGLVGEDGATHHGVFDLSFLRPMPNLAIIAPASATELSAALALALSADSPVAIRYPRGNAPRQTVEDAPALAWGQAAVLRDGSELVIIAEGRMVFQALATAELLAHKGLNPTVVDIRFIKPLDEKLLSSLVLSHPYWVVMEENALAGGLSSGITEWLTDTKASVKIWRVGVPDQFVEHGSMAALYNVLEWHPEQMAATILAQWPELNEVMSARRCLGHGER